MERQLFNDINPLPAIAPCVVADNAPLVGTAISAVGPGGQAYDSVTYVIQTGALGAAGATFTTLLEESDTGAFGGEQCDVDDIDLLGTEDQASFAGTASGKTFKLGTKTTRRYTRLTLTPAGNNQNAYISAIAILGHPRRMPVPNPPSNL